MQTTTLTTTAWGAVPLHTCHTLVLGTGAAGLNAAVQLRRHGVADVQIVTEGLEGGTSINTGSDKQTYYKLGLCGETPDSLWAMAQDLFAGGAMHGDMALVEAANSVRSFLHLVNLGVPFPHDRYGQFAGYKTDHDPRQRATSTGPYTSRDMCHALIDEVRQLNLPLHEGHIAVALLTLAEGEDNAERCAGIVTLNAEGRPAVFMAENTILAVGGPGGIYHQSVYPEGHLGAIGLALEVGAQTQNLPESQHGLAAMRPRWNVSGSYVQVLPRVISTDQDGHDPQPFLFQTLGSFVEYGDRLFLKGYQWPFEASRAASGSSLIDLIVWQETALRGRRVFLDYSENPEGWNLNLLGSEAHDYLTRSGATGETPFERLHQMNPDAIALFREHKINLATEPIEIAVCSQHNNGGLATNVWWESANLPHLFPVGEVNGSHGLRRPGGSALNSGQVGGLRAAEYVAARAAGWTLDKSAARKAARTKLDEISDWLTSGEKAGKSWCEERDILQKRMSHAGAMLRDAETLQQAVAAARKQMQRLDKSGCRWRVPAERAEALRTRMLCLTHHVYLEAIAFAVSEGVGSRGSALVLDPAGTTLPDYLPQAWRPLPENRKFRNLVQMTRRAPDGSVVNEWQPCRPIPQSDSWFETAWAAYREGKIYDKPHL